MKEKIIVAPEVSETELLRTLAKYGKNTFNTRVMSPYDFALYVLEKNGICLNKEYIPANEEAFAIYKQVKSIKYYEKITFEDIMNICKSLDELRYNIQENEKDTINKLKDGEFKDKNEAIIELYNAYIKNLNDINKIDTIQTIREVISKDIKLANANIVYLEEFPLKPLEKKLVEKFNAKSEKLANNNSVVITKYIKSFGMKTEIENIINEISKNKISYDKCLIVVPEEKTYPHIIKDYFDEFNIPYTMGINESILDTNVGKVYRLISRWQDNFAFKDDFVNLVNDPAFDKKKLFENIGYDESKFINTFLDHKNAKDLIIECCGKLRIYFNEEGNNKNKIKECLKIKESLKNKNDSDTLDYYLIYEYVEKIINEINEGLAYFIETYTRDVDQNPVESMAFDKLKNILDLACIYEIPFKEVEKIISSQTCKSTQSHEGCVHITSIKKALSVCRDNVFVVGLSASNYPGSPREDDTILDNDYKLIGIENYSQSKIKEKKDAFDNLMNICSSNKSNIYLSYAYYNEQTHKEQTLSSVLFNTYKKENGSTLTLKSLTDRFEDKEKNKKDEEQNEQAVNKDKDKYKKIEMFKFDLSMNNKLVNGKLCNTLFNETIVQVGNNPIDVIDGKINKFLSKAISASALEDFIKCEMYFFLKDCLYLDTYFKDTNFEVIASNEMGTLIHESLERLGKKNILDPSQKDRYIKDGLALFDEYLVFNVPANLSLIDKKKKELEEYLDNAYEMYSSLDTYLKEDDLVTTHSSGLKVHGFPDRVVLQSDGTLKVIDYKVKNKIEHNNNDPETIAQIALYAYILQKEKNVKVSSAEYVYIKQKERILLDSECLNKEIGYIDAVLNNMKQCIETATYRQKSDAKQCNKMYCPFKTICHKEDKK